MTPTATTTATCPECEGTLSLGADTQTGEIVVCGDCGVDLEVLNVSPLELALAPQEAEDWGE
jgi:alpha-aminoadipate carrier protein LysW